MRLWPLQLVIIALALAVGWGLANFPTMRVPPAKIKQMCADPLNSDEIARRLCREINGG